MTIERIKIVVIKHYTDRKNKPKKFKSTISCNKFFNTYYCPAYDYVCNMPKAHPSRAEILSQIGILNVYRMHLDELKMVMNVLTDSPNNKIEREYFFKELRDLDITVKIKEVSND